MCVMRTLTMVMWMVESVTIRIPRWLRKALSVIGQKGQTYGEVIEYLAKAAGHAHVLAACRVDEEAEEP